MFIPDQDPNFFPFRIPDPGSKRHRTSDPGSARLLLTGLEEDGATYRELSPGSSWRGSGSGIRILIFYPSRIPDPGVKKASDPGSATLLLTGLNKRMVQRSVPGSGKKPIPDPGSGSRVKKAPDPGSRIRIRNTGATYRELCPGSSWRGGSCVPAIHSLAPSPA